MQSRRGRPQDSPSRISLSSCEGPNSTSILPRIHFLYVLPIVYFSYALSTQALWRASLPG
ncbi:hypothetical protein I7I50_07500 [Histoplasma capsulatum G186AR]|uniref:Uncharacterized protein n=1 Tax=Ajellomyces capsulatus TaxID=5037 RepID=A0A8H7YZW5_AJECA|nr:hypothetical protein I7I52_09428 [Histoplasma capsulatum]QSS68178.1 hypothetical protein I7I50_07500 [Histoplasma capsulatum G186AR]